MDALRGNVQRARDLVRPRVRDREYSISVTHVVLHHASQRALPVETAAPVLRGTHPYGVQQRDDACHAGDDRRPDVGETVQDIEPADGRQQRKGRELEDEVGTLDLHTDRAVHPAHRIRPWLIEQIRGRVTGDEDMNLRGGLDRQQRSGHLPGIAARAASGRLQEDEIQAHPQWALRFEAHARETTGTAAHERRRNDVGISS